MPRGYPWFCTQWAWGPLQCWGLNPGWQNAVQASYLLDCVSTVPSPLFFVFGWFIISEFCPFCLSHASTLTGKRISLQGRGCGSVSLWLRYVRPGVCSLAPSQPPNRHTEKFIFRTFCFRTCLQVIIHLTCSNSVEAAGPGSQGMLHVTRPRPPPPPLRSAPAPHGAAPRGQLPVLAAADSFMG